MDALFRGPTVDWRLRLPVEHISDSHLTASHLRLVVAIVEEGSLVGAAKRLNMTQPAVTKALQAAEHQLGVALFNRTSSGMVATVYGEALVARARMMLSQLSHAVQEINDLRDGTGGRISVGTLLAASSRLLPEAIARLRKSRPKLVVTVREGTDDILIPALRRGELDLVVGRLPENYDQMDLIQEVLIVDIACVVVRPNHPLVGRQPLGLSDLLEWDWILPTQETTLRGQIDKSFWNESLTPPLPAVESVCLSTNRALLQLTDYLSAWPWQVACRDARLNEIAILPILLAPTKSPIGITLRRNDSLSPVGEALVQALRTAAEELQVSPMLEYIPPGNIPQK